MVTGERLPSYYRSFEPCSLQSRCSSSLLEGLGFLIFIHILCLFSSGLPCILFIYFFYVAECVGGNKNSKACFYIRSLKIQCVRTEITENYI